jgi:hypothetical protein
MTRKFIFPFATAIFCACSGVSASADTGGFLQACIEGRSSAGGRLALDARIDACSELKRDRKSAFMGTYFRARLKKEARDWVGAERDYTAALALQPNTPAAWYDRGRIRLAHLDAASQAVADLSEAIWLTRVRPRDYYFLARADAYTKLAGEGRAPQDLDTDMLRRARADLTQFLEMSERSKRAGHKDMRAAALSSLARIDEILATD